MVRLISRIRIRLIESLILNAFFFKIPCIDKLEESLIIFNDLIKDYPNCASILNNRAQVLQLMKRLDSALEDLNRAINLCDQNRNRKVLGQSLCQRALIHRLRGEDQQSYQDFTKASQLGNMFARRQLVALNPYAALCNQMLGQMLNNVRQGKQPDA